MVPSTAVKLGYVYPNPILYARRLDQLRGKYYADIAIIQYADITKYLWVQINIYEWMANYIIITDVQLMGSKINEV